MKNTMKLIIDKVIEHFPETKKHEYMRTKDMLHHCDLYFEHKDKTRIFSIKVEVSRLDDIYENMDTQFNDFIQLINSKLSDFLESEDRYGTFTE